MHPRQNFLGCPGTSMYIYIHMYTYECKSIPTRLTFPDSRTHLLGNLGLTLAVVGICILRGSGDVVRRSVLGINGVNIRQTDILTKSPDPPSKQCVLFCTVEAVAI